MRSAEQVWQPAPDDYVRGDALPAGATQLDSAGLNALEQRIKAVGSVPTIVEVGAENSAGIRYRTVVPTPKAAQEGSYATYWGPAYDTAFVESQMDGAQALGCNAVKLVLSPGGVIDGTYAQSTYLAHVRDWCERATAGHGMAIYVLLTDNSPGPTSGGRGSLAQELDQANAVMVVLRDFLHWIIGVDGINEVAGPTANFWTAARGFSNDAPDPATVQWLNALLTAVHTGLPGKPMTFSLFDPDGSLIADTDPNGWTAKMKARSDAIRGPGWWFTDAHPYQSDMMVPWSHAAVLTFGAAWPGVALWFGETALFTGNADHAGQPILWGRMAEFMDRYGFVAGAVLFPLNPWQTVAHDGVTPGLQGPFDMAWAPIENLVGPFMRTPRHVSYEAVARMVLASKALGALGDVDTVSLDHADYTAVPMARAHGRVVGRVVGAATGNAASVIVEDASGHQVAAGSCTVVGGSGASTVPDGSSHARVGTLIGGPVLSASGGGRFGKALVLDGTQRLTTPQFSLGSAFSIRVRAKRASSAAGAEQYLVCLPWAAGGSTGAGNVIVAMFVSGDNNWTSLCIDAGGNFVGSTMGSAASTAFTELLLDWDGTTLRGFVDGVMGQTNPMASLHTPDGTTPMAIGANSLSTSGGFVGEVDYVQIENASLHTANYTPLVAAPSSDAGTLWLPQFDTITVGSGPALGSVATDWFTLPGGVGKVRASGDAGTLMPELELRWA